MPITLAKVVGPRSAPRLEAWPSWEMQSYPLGDPAKLQFVQSMEIDSRGWMWILDVGRLNLLSDPSIQVGASTAAGTTLDETCRFQPKHDQYSELLSIRS